MDTYFNWGLGFGAEAEGARFALGVSCLVSVYVGSGCIEGTSQVALMRIANKELVECKSYGPIPTSSVKRKSYRTIPSPTPACKPSKPL